MNDETFMALALAQAREAAAAGEVPVGAVVVRHGQVIAIGRNNPIHGNDPTSHAEIAALRAAALALGNYRLDECELFVTLEPCAMCSGAMLQARLRRVIFGAAEPKTGAAGSVLNLFSLRQLNHQTALQGGLMATQSRALLQDFFRQRRTKQRETAKKLHPLRDDALRTPDAAFDGLMDYPWAPHYLSDLPALDGLRMHYLDEGQRKEDGHNGQQQTFLCLHDGFGWSYMHRKLIFSLLQAGHRVVAPDLPGFGKSDKPKKENFHTFSNHRQIMNEWVDRLNLKHIVLVLATSDDLLGLSLPLAASQRYRALWIMEMTQVSDREHKLVIKNGLRLLANGSIPSEFDSAMLFCSQHEEACHAFQCPFPDSGHRAALRAFSKGLWRQDSADWTDFLQKVLQFWQTSWPGEILVPAHGSASVEW